MKSPNITSRLTLGALFFCAASASAATLYFDPGTTTTTSVDNLGTTNTVDGGGTFPNDLWGGGAGYSNWNTATDGTGSLTFFNAGDDAVFGDAASIGNATYYVGTHSMPSIGSITFGSQGTWVLQQTYAGGTLSGLNLGTGVDISVASGKTARIESALSGGSIGSKSGDGTLEWASASGFTNAGALAVNGGTFLLERTNVGATNNTVTGLGKVAYRGSATPGFGQEWDLRSTTSTFSGGFDLLRGQIRVGANSAGAFGAPTAGPLGTGTFTIGGEGDAIVYSDAGRTLHNNITVASGPGTKTLLNANAASNFWSGNMTLNDDLTVETNGVAGTSSTHNIYNVTGTGGFTVGDGADSTTLRLRESGANSTYSGTTTVLTNSTVLVGEPGVTSDFSVMNLAGGTFQSGGATTQTVRGFTGNGTILTDGAFTTLGIRTQTGDNLSFSGTWSLGNAATFIVVNGVNGAGGVQNFDSAVGAIGRMDVINGAVVNVNSTLDASAGGTDIVVEAGGVLGGTGTITGDVLVGDGTTPGNAFIAAGNSIGTLNVIGNVDFTFKSHGSMISEIDTAGNISDLLNITGDVIFGSGSVIDVNNIGGTLLLGDTFDLLDWTGTITGAGLVAFDFTNAALDTGLSWDTSSFGIDGTISVVPEPSTFALLGGLLALTWVMTRRRQA